MKIIEFNLENAEKEKMISRFLELHNQENNLKMLSFTGIPFGEDFFRELINSRDDMGIKQFHLIDENENIPGFIVTKESIMFGFELLGIAIDNQERRKGLATKLIDFACNYAQEKGHKMVFTTVFADNKKMLRLLIGLDFIPVNITHHSRYDGTDLVILQKRF